LKLRIKRTVMIKDNVYEQGTIRDVEDSLAKWMIDKGIAELAEAEGEALPAQYPTELKPETSYDKLMKLAEAHLVEIYGAYGTGKSRLMHHIAVEAQNAGKRVLFIDTEGGLLDEHVRQLQNYWYVGDSLEALRDAVSQAKKRRKEYDLLIVDSVGHPVYVNYVELETMRDKLTAYQELALIFRDMVRFARGEKGKDLGERRALAAATNHPVSEFARVAKDLPPEEPLNPFGGQIHRVPKVILRSEPAELTVKKSVFKLLSFKLRGLPKNLEVARFTIDDEGVKIYWKI